MNLAGILRSCCERRALPGAAQAPGLVAMVCSSDAVALDASGMAVVEHGVVMTTGTRLYAASLAKVVTALCVHRLTEQGVVDPDAPVQEWFPLLAGADEITVRHLLMHRSGLPEYHALRLVAGHDVEDRLEHGDVIRLVDGMTAWFPPGERDSYNNTNYAMLAHIVARVTGEPFPDAAARLVFEPAGMASAVVRRSSDMLLADAATGYVRAGAGWHRALLGAASMGDGGMWWSGNDLAALGRVLLRGGLPSATGLDASVARLREQRPLPNGRVPGLASGCIVSPAGWFGALAEFVGFRAELRAYPDAGLAIGAMANVQDAPIGPLLDDLAHALGVPAAPPVPPWAPEPGPVPDGVLVGVGGAAWRFAAGDDRTCSVAVGDMSFRLTPDGEAWTVVERPSVVAAWQGAELVVRDGGAEIARLAPVGSVPGRGADLDAATGWWWCAPAHAVLVVERDGDSLHVRRGQREPEPLEPIGERRGRQVFAAPWGLVELDREGDAGLVVLGRAEGLPLQRLAPTRPG